MKLELSLCRRREHVGEWRYSSLHSETRLWMGVSGPAYSPVRLRPENDPSGTNEEKFGWAL